MFVQTWKKYLPVIVVLMKRSVKGEQNLDMNHTDFERAAGGRKIKLSFSTITLDNGRIDYGVKQSVLVSDLIMVLQQSNQAEMLMQHQQFNFSMDINCQLTITNSSQLIGERP